MREEMGEGIRICIVCRGSVQEGLGHLYRASSFAQIATVHHDVHVIALCDPVFAPIFAKLARAPHLVSDEVALADALERIAPTVTVLDLIDLADPVFARLRAASPFLASISPVLRHAGRTDMFFTRGAPPAGLERVSVHAGLEFAIINASCRRVADEQFEIAIAAPALPIMISFGGADADNHTRMTLEVLREIEQPLLLWLMLGDGYLHSHDELVRTIRDMPHHEIILARTNRSMWSIAANCALAILSSGMSTIEAIYAGLPVISVRRLNDPSRQVATAYDDHCLDGGDFALGSHSALRTLVETLGAGRDQLRTMRARQKGLIDGLGAQRVLAAIERHVSERKP